MYSFTEEFVNSSSSTNTKHPKKIPVSKQTSVFQKRKDEKITQERGDELRTLNPRHWNVSLPTFYFYYSRMW